MKNLSIFKPQIEKHYAYKKNGFSFIEIPLYINIKNNIAGNISHFGILNEYEGIVFALIAPNPINPS